MTKRSRYQRVLRVSFLINTVFWILSPLGWVIGFGGLRILGVVNTAGYDWVIGLSVFLVLSLCSAVTAYLNFGRE